MIQLGDNAAQLSRYDQTIPACQGIPAVELDASPADFVTVATAADGKLMTKVFFVDGEGREQTRSFDKGCLFNFSTQAIACLDDLTSVGERNTAFAHHSANRLRKSQ